MTKIRNFIPATEKDFGATKLIADNSYAKNVKTGEQDVLIAHKICRIISFPFWVDVPPSRSKGKTIVREFVLVQCGDNVFMILNSFRNEKI